MEFTKYGRDLAATEPHYVPLGVGGVTEHVQSCAYDVGTKIILTGHDNKGKAFRMEAGSVFGAYMKATAAWGIERAWHEDKDGKRKLVFKR